MFTMLTAPFFAGLIGWLFCKWIEYERTRGLGSVLVGVGTALFMRWDGGTAAQRHAERMAGRSKRNQKWCSFYSGLAAGGLYAVVLSKVALWEGSMAPLWSAAVFLMFWSLAAVVAFSVPLFAIFWRVKDLEAQNALSLREQDPQLEVKLELAYLIKRARRKICEPALQLFTGLFFLSGSVIVLLLYRL